MLALLEFGRYTVLHLVTGEVLTIGELTEFPRVQSDIDWFEQVSLKKVGNSYYKGTYLAQVNIYNCCVVSFRIMKSGTVRFKRNLIAPDFAIQKLIEQARDTLIH